MANTARQWHALTGCYGQAPQALCPQRWLEMRSPVREDDVRQHVIEMDSLLRGVTHHEQQMGYDAARPVEAHVPKGHPCLKADNPLHDCACFYKIALHQNNAAKTKAPSKEEL